MTPADRSRVHATGEKAANPFAAFAPEAMAAKRKARNARNLN
jgi:hypothetical protein